MTTCAILLVGLALPGDGSPPDVSKVYPVADLLVPALPQRVDKVYPVGDLVVPAWRLKAFEHLYLRALQDAKVERERRYFDRLFQLKKDHVPYPEPELMPRPPSEPIDPALGFYPPSKALIEKAPSKRK